MTRLAHTNTPDTTDTPDTAQAPRTPQVSAAAAPPDLLRIVAVPIEPTQAIVQVAGELDCATAGQLTSALDAQLALGHRFMRLDLSSLTFLDCAGLRALVRAHNKFLHAGGTFVLTGVGHRVARLLRITRLDEALFVADGLDQPARVRHLASVPNDEAS